MTNAAWSSGPYLALGLLVGCGIGFALRSGVSSNAAKSTARPHLMQLPENKVAIANPVILAGDLDLLRTNMKRELSGYADKLNSLSRTIATAAIRMLPHEITAGNIDTIDFPIALYAYRTSMENLPTVVIHSIVPQRQPTAIIVAYGDMLGRTILFRAKWKQSEKFLAYEFNALLLLEESDIQSMVGADDRPAIIELAVEPGGVIPFCKDCAMAIAVEEINGRCSNFVPVFVMQ